MPTYGANANFRGPCARHDMCYDPAKDITNKTLREREFMRCDTNFYNDLRAVCHGVYEKYDPRWAGCLRLTGVYYSAVVAKHWYNYDYV